MNQNSLLNNFLLNYFNLTYNYIFFINLIDFYILHLLQSYTWKPPTITGWGRISEERRRHFGCECWQWWRRVVETGSWRCRERRTFYGSICTSTATSSATSPSSADSPSATSAFARGSTTFRSASSATATGSTALATATTTRSTTAARHYYTFRCPGKSHQFVFSLFLILLNREKLKFIFFNNITLLIK